MTAAICLDRINGEFAMKRGTLVLLVAILALLTASAGAVRSQTQRPQTADEIQFQLAKCNLDRTTLEREVRELQGRLAAVADADALRVRAEAAEKELQRARTDCVAFKQQVAALTREKESLRGELARARREETTPSRPAAPVNAPAQAVAGAWRIFEETTIEGTVQKIEQGTLFKTTTGNLYEVTDVVLELVLELNPKVTVLTNGHIYKLTIAGVRKVLLCSKLGDAIGTTGEVIESRIDDAFEGFEFGKLFKLRNGQIWEQTNSKYRYRYKYAPSVIIWKSGAEFKMRVDGVDDEITVKRLK